DQARAGHTRTHDLPQGWSDSATLPLAWHPGRFSAVPLLPEWQCTSSRYHLSPVRHNIRSVLLGSPERTLLVPVVTCGRIQIQRILRTPVLDALKLPHALKLLLGQIPTHFSTTSTSA